MGQVHRRKYSPIAGGKGGLGQNAGGDRILPKPDEQRHVDTGLEWVGIGKYPGKHLYFYRKFTPSE